MYKDEELKSNYGNITNKHEGKHLSEEEWDKVVMEDMKAQHKPAGKELADEELDEVVGGRGEFIHTLNIGRVRFEKTMSCEFAPDDQTFKARYYAWPFNDCPDHRSEYSSRCCDNCVNLKVGKPTRA